MAELIQRTDDLNTGREKLNNAIFDAEDAKQKSDHAVNVSEQAKQIAQTAENKADNVQEQFNQVVIEGDSSVEAAQARVDADGNTFTTLKERLDTKETQFAAQLAQTQKNIEDIALDIKTFGAVGDGITDDTEAYKAFLSHGGNLRVSKGVYRVKADFYTVPSNTVLTFDEGAEIKLLEHDSQNYSILQIKDADNVTVIRPNIDGNKAENKATTGEWGHGIDILNSTNVVVLDYNIRNTWGDGIYIGHDYWGESEKETENIRIGDGIIDGSRRNGISLCGGRNIKIGKVTIRNIRGTNPQAALDIEPEGMGGVKPFLEEVTIESIIAEDCGIGVELNLSSLAQRNLTSRITINHIKSIECNTPLTIRSLSGGLKGSVNYGSVEVVNAKNGVLYMENYNAIDTPTITIGEMIVNGFNTTQSTNDFYNHLITISSHPERLPTYDVGNLNILNLVAIDNTNNVFRFLYARLRGQTTYKIKNVSIINPVIITSKKIVSHARDNPEINIVDTLKSLSISPTYFEEHIKDTLSKHIDNRNMADWLYVYADDAHTPIGHTIKLVLYNNQRITFRPSTYIEGYTTKTNQGIYSGKAGSILELTFIGDRWIVENMQGEWLTEE